MAEIRVKAGIDSTQYKRAIDEMQRKNQGLGKSVSPIGGLIKKAFGVIAILKFAQMVKNAIGSLVDFGSKMTDLAYQTGTSVETFQKLERAVRNAGGEQQNLVNALTKLRDAQGDVVRGDNEAIEAFRDLGLSIEQVASLDTEQLFIAVSKAVTEAGNSGKAFSAAADVLGRRNLPKLLEAMNEIGGASGDLARGFGELETANAQALDAMADGWANFWADIKEGASNTLGSLVRAFSRGFLGKDIGLEREQKAQEQAEVERVNRQREAATVQADLARKEREEAQKLSLEREKQTEKLKEQIENVAEGVKLEIQTDSFRAIGGRLGGSVSEQLKFARRELQIAEQTREILARVEINTRIDNGGLA